MKLKRLSDPYWFQALGCVVGFEAAICCDRSDETLNLVSKSNQMLNQTSCKIANIEPKKLLNEIDKIKCDRSLRMPSRHSIPKTSYLNKSLTTAYEQQPQNFEQLLQIAGVGPGTLRALCLVAEVAFGVEASYTDPVRYSFAHGGKDGFPFPVNEADIENSYTVFNKALRRSRAGHSEQLKALKNLAKWHSEALSYKNINCTPSSLNPSNKYDAKRISPHPNAPDCKPSFIQGELFSD